MLKSIKYLEIVIHPELTSPTLIEVAALSVLIMLSISEILFVAYQQYLTAYPVRMCVRSYGLRHLCS